MTELRAIRRNDPAFGDFCAALEAADLPTLDLDEGDATYFTDEAGSFGGLVRLGNMALLRSIVVPRSKQRHGLGTDMLAGLIGAARKSGAREVWLLTTTAEGFFAANGFERVARTDAPAALAATSQFKGVCPDSAALMRLVLA
jgi:GNAT superfamily N-acetyltransferase